MNLPVTKRLFGVGSASTVGWIGDPSYGATRRTCRQACSAIATVLLACFVGNLSAAAELRPDKGRTSIIHAYRRVYVPENRIKDWPRGDAKYDTPPIAIEEFERLTEKIEEQVGPDGLAALVVDAEYTARLDGSQLVDGSASLQVTRLQDGAVLVPLTGCGLAVESARSTQPSEKPAIVGCAADESAIAVVDASAEDLHFDWSLRGSLTLAGEVEFDVHLPACPANRFVVYLPPQFEPWVDAGVVRGPHNGTQDDAQPRRWQIELGGRTDFVLRIVAAESSGRHRETILCQQAVRYMIEHGGVEVAAQFRIDVHRGNARRLPLEVDPRLTLTSARLGDAESGQTVSWLTSAAAMGKPRPVVLELPQVLSGPGHVVRVHAVAPAPPGASWELPYVRPAQGITWMGTRVELQVPQPLGVERVFAEQCVQTGVVPLPSPQLGQSLKFAYLRPDARLNVHVDRPDSRFELASGTTIVISPESISARVVTDLLAGQGERFEFIADVPGKWDIESVDVLAEDPATQDRVSVMDEWRLREHQGRQRLEISLQRALTPQRPLRCIVLGNRTINLREKLGIDDFRIVRFREAVRTQAVIAVAAAGSGQLKLESNASLMWLDPEDLSEGDRQRLDTPAEAFVFTDDAAASDAIFALRDEDPTFSATIDVEATVADDALAESYRFRIVPQRAPLSEVLVHLSQSRPSPVQWSITASDEDPTTVTGVLAEELSTDGSEAGGQSWRIRLPEPQSEPFTVVGRRTTPLVGQLPISLAATPGADSQRAVLTVLGATDKSLFINTRRLRAVPIEVAPPGRTTTVRAAYRYEPSRDALTARRPVISVSVAPRGTGAAGAWVWSARLISHYADSNLVRHVATLRIENHFRNHMTVKMPSGAIVRRVAVDDGGGRSKEVSFDDSSELAVPLPAGARYPVVLIEYEANRPPPGVMGWVKASFPQTDLPVLSRQWDVWVAPQYRMYGRDRRIGFPQPAPPSLGERLMGPLWRRGDRGAFNLFSVGAWSSLVSGPPEAAQMDEVADVALNQFGDAMGTLQAQEATITWGDLLSQYLRNVKMGRRALPALLVDENALAEAGIHPDTEVTERGGRGLRLGTQLFRRTGLVLLVAPEAMLMTTPAALSQRSEQLISTEFPIVWRVDRGPLRSEMATNVGEVSRFARAETWIRTGPANPLPWQEASLLASPTLLDRGWSLTTFHVSSDHPGGVLVYRPTFVRAIAWIAFFVIACVVFTVAQRRAVVWVCCGVGAAVLAWLLPDPLSPIGSGLFLGVIVAGLVRLTTTRSATRTRRHAPSADTSRAAAAAVLIAVLGIFALSSNTALAQPAPPLAAIEKKTPERIIHRVLVPVDDQGNPTGKCYLPEQLYEVLHRHDRLAGTSPQPWWLKSAQYRATLDWRDGGTALRLVQMSVDYQVEVFENDTIIRLPLAREGKCVAADTLTVSLDGRSVASPWQENPQVAVIPVDSPGEYRIEISYLPTAELPQVASGFDLAIPAVASADLELTVPTDCPAIELPTAMGGGMDRRADGRISARLGPTDHLVVGWQPRAAAGVEDARAEIRQLLWLDVHAGAVLLKTKLGIRVFEGDLPRLRIRTDPGMQLLEHDELVDRVKVPSGTKDVQIVDLVFAEPIANAAAIELTWLLTDSPDVNQVRLPRLETLGATTAERLLGVTIDSALELDEAHDDTVDLLPGEDFVAAWGRLPRLPRRAYRLRPEAEVAWSASISPVQPKTTVQQQTVATVGRDGIDVDITADLDTTGGEIYGYTLAAPREFQMSRVTLTHGNRQQNIRWFQQPAGKVALRLDQPISGAQQLRVQGRLPVSLDEPVTLTPLRLQEADTTAHRLRLDRRFGVLVETMVEEDVSLVEQPDVSVPDTAVRTIAAWDVISENAQIDLSVKRNDLLTKTTTVTSVKSVRGNWHVEFDYHVVVEPTLVETSERASAATVDAAAEKKRGLLDLVQFDLPPEVVGLTPIDPPVTGRIVELSGSNRKRFVIRPDEPISEEYHWRGVVTVEHPQHSPKRVPEILALGAGDVDRFVVLPMQLEDGPIEWGTQGLWPEALPATYAGSDLEEHEAVFQAKAATTTAVFKTVQRTTSWPRVRLADIRIASQTGSVYCGVACFHLDPAGHTRAVLQLPDSCSLVQATVCGVPAVLYPQAGIRGWELMLGPDRLPQTVRVIYVGEVTVGAEPGQSPHVAAPVLKGIDVDVIKDIPVDHTLWTYCPLGTAAAAQPVPATNAVGPLTQDLMRWETGLNMMNLPTGVLADTPPDELMDWYVGWTREQAAVRHRIDYATAGLEVANESAAKLQEQWEIEQDEWATRFGAAGAPAPTGDRATAACEPAGLFATLTATPVAPTRRSSTQETTQLTVAGPFDGSGDTWLRMLAIFCLLLAAAALYFVDRRQPIADVFLGYPRLVGVLVGLVWWLWLTPSFFGWVIVAVSLIPLVRRFPVVSAEPDTTRAATLPILNGSRR